MTVHLVFRITESGLVRFHHTEGEDTPNNVWYYVSASGPLILGSEDHEWRVKPQRPRVPGWSRRWDRLIRYHIGQYLRAAVATADRGETSGVVTVTTPVTRVVNRLKKERAVEPKKPLNRKAFITNAKPVTITLFGHEVILEPVEFRTGSLGYCYQDKLPARIGNQDLRFQISINAIVIGSKPHPRIASAGE